MMEMYMADVSFSAVSTTTGAGVEVVSFDSVSS